MKGLFGLKKTERWYQSVLDEDVWEHESGLLVNTSALSERECFYKVIRIPAAHKRFEIALYKKDT